MYCFQLSWIDVVEQTQTTMVLEALEAVKISAATEEEVIVVSTPWKPMRATTSKQCRRQLSCRCKV